MLEDLNWLDLMPVLSAIAVTVLVLWAASRLLRRQPKLCGEGGATRHIILLLLVLIGLVSIILTLPLNDETRGQLLGLLGLALTAVIALSSTTFVSNAMAGFMLRAVRAFQPGDFIQVGEHFGRVTERALFHTEIQTEDRDLTTLPNMYLVSHPVKAVRTSGTIVSASLSLGYDVPRSRVEPLLLAAAEKAGLNEPFVQIQELGDFSVMYRIAGFLPEVKTLLTKRSALRASVLDVLHGAGIEIVSPAFMNQRVLPTEAAIIPAPPVRPAPEPAAAEEATPEAIIFDKAELAEQIARARAERAELGEQIKTLQGQLGKAADAEKAALERRIKALQRRVEMIEQAIADVGEDAQDM